jgi:hypothetical protein
VYPAAIERARDESSFVWLNISALGYPAPYPLTVAVAVTVSVTVAVEVTVIVIVAIFPGITRDEIPPGIENWSVWLGFARVVLGVGGLPVTVTNSVRVVVTSSVDSWEVCRSVCLGFARLVLRVGGLPSMVMNSVTVVVTPSVGCWVGKPGALIDPGMKAIVVVDTGNWGTAFVVDDTGWVSVVGATPVAEEPSGTGPPTNVREVDDAVIIVVGGVASVIITDALVDVAMLFEDVAFPTSTSCACSVVSQSISTPVPEPVFGRA